MPSWSATVEGRNFTFIEAICFWCFDLSIRYSEGTHSEKCIPPAASYELAADAMLAEEGVEVGAVDVDFAAYLREGDEALVAVVLPRLGGYAEELSSSFGFYPFAAGVVGVAPGDEVDDLLQCGMEVAPFFFRHYEQ